MSAASVASEAYPYKSIHDAMHPFLHERGGVHDNIIIDVVAGQEGLAPES